VTDDSKEIAKHLIRTVPLVMRVVNVELRRSAPLQDFSQVGLLRVIGHKGPLTMSKLADLWTVSLPTMSRSIRRFEERGWVALTRTQEDRRQVLVELTEDGRSVLAESFETMAHSVSVLIETLPPEDRVTLAAGLEMLLKVFTDAVRLPTEPDNSEGLLNSLMKRPTEL
jgi:DNA-binding MarR family transcriptional regulator